MMKLRCLASGSAGNCWLLESETECLILDAGVKVSEVKKALDFDVLKIVGVCVTHSHADHSLAVNDFKRMGIPVLRPYEAPEYRYYMGGFSIYTFPLKHNVSCCGYYIQHTEFHSLVYATDTCYVPQNFRKLRPRHLLIECNWSEKYVEINEGKYRHELEDHMEQETCMNFIRANVTDALQSVILCHLSQSAIDPAECVSEAKKIVPLAKVDYARAGLEVELRDEGACPFI